jgi:hypothetical protein
MASNRSNLKSRSAAQPARGETPRDALAAVARDGARIQIAAIGAAGKAVAVWTQAADRFTEAIGDELLRRVDGQTDSRELIVRVISAADLHLRDLAALPSAATDHFDALLSHASINN